LNLKPKQVIQSIGL